MTAVSDIAELLTIEEVAERLRISVFTVRRRLAEHPEVAPIKTGRSIVFDARALSALEEALRCRDKNYPASNTSPREHGGTTGTGSALSGLTAGLARSERRSQARQVRRELHAGPNSGSASSKPKVVLLDTAKRP